MKLSKEAEQVLYRYAETVALFRADGIEMDFDRFRRDNDDGFLVELSLYDEGPSRMDTVLRKEYRFHASFLPTAWALIQKQSKEV